MAIDIRTMADGGRQAFDERLALTVPKAYGVLDSPVHVSVAGALIRHGDAFTALAECRAELRVECARCLAPVPLNFSFPLEETFADDPQGWDADADVWPVVDKRIDLTAAVESNLYSLIPSRALCERDEADEGLTEEPNEEPNEEPIEPGGN